MKPIRFALTSAALATSLLISSAMAQEVNPAVEKAARAAIAATQATDSFDNILPKASLAVKNVLTTNNPDKAQEIDNMVDEETLKLAPRRGALENEAIKLFAANFNQQELEEISTFFSSNTGKKYLTLTPILARELSKAARVWSGGVQRDLNESTTKRMQEMLAQ